MNLQETTQQIKSFIKNNSKESAFAVFIVLALIFFGTGGYEFLTALVYPIEIEEEELRPGNVLVVESFVDGVETPGAAIGEVPNYGNLNSFPTSGLSGTTPYEVYGEGLIKHPEWPEMKNIVLRAPRVHGGGYFSGWSGCDATDDLQQEVWEEPVTEGELCQVSVTDSQIRKVEAHYKKPNEELGLQIFSISKNPLGGQLNDSWLNTHPELIYKASYIDVDGPIPDSIGDLSVAGSLQLNLGGNPLGGEIPEQTGNLGSIDYLGLYKAELEGEIPEELGNLRPIYFLAYMNELEGEIPEELGDMGSRPARFEIHDNYLTGIIPSELNQLTGLEPNEMRFYKNMLEGAEEGLISDSNWEGVNFNTNEIDQSEAENILEDAAERSGTYIDLCANQAIGGSVEYEINGDCTNTNIIDEVNEAVEMGWDVYIPIELYQNYRWWVCSSASCNCSYDEDGICGICDARGCQPTQVSGQKPFCGGRAECVRIEEPINSCEDIIPNSEGLPYHVFHASHCPGCSYWIHPDCEPICEHTGTCSCTTDTLGCEQTGTVSGSRDSLPNHNINPSKSEGCFDVHRTY